MCCLASKYIHHSISNFNVKLQSHSTLEDDLINLHDEDIAVEGFTLSDMVASKLRKKNLWQKINIMMVRQ